MIEFFESLALQWQSLPFFWSLVVAYLVHFAIYVSIATGISLWFSHRIFKNGVLHDTRPLGKNQIRYEITHSAVTCVIYAFYTAVCVRISKGVWPESWLEGMLQLALFFVFYDIYFYWTHRLLHTPRFTRFHGVHHRSVRVTPWAVHSLHPVEAANNQLPVLLFMLIWPSSLSFMFFVYVALMYFPAVGHCNFDPYPKYKWLLGIKRLHQFHQLHHMRGEPGNYGFFSLFWDKLFDTAYEQATPNKSRHSHP